MRNGVVPDPGNGTVVVFTDGCREVVLGQISGVEPLVAFEAVARLHLAASRHGGRVHARTGDPVLIALFDLVGMRDLVEEG